MTESASGKGENVSVNKAVRQGFLWNLLNFLISQGAGIAIFLLLSRAVTPAIYGVFAIAATIVDLFGFQGRWAAMDALIQRRDYSQRALSTAFFSLMGVVVALVVISIACAGLMADAFGEASLRHVLPALAITLLFTPPIIVMDALIMRNLQFRASAIRSIVGTLFGGAAGLAVAFSPAVEWALVAQRLVTSVVTLVVMFAFTRWIPQWTFDVASVGGFLRRSLQLWATSILSSLQTSVVHAAVGFRAGVEALGLVIVARRFENLLHGPVTTPIQALWVPVLSVLRTDMGESWRLFLRLSQLTALVALPAFVGLSLVAHELVVLLLDARYRDADDILVVIALHGLFIPVGYFANLVFTGLDRSDLSLKFSLIGIICYIPAIWLASAYGAVAALWVSFVATGALGLVATFVQIRMFHGRCLEFAKALAPGYFGIAAMAAAVLALKYFLPIENSALSLVSSMAVGAVAYGSWLIAFHRSQVMEAWRFFASSRAGGGITAAVS